MGKEMAEEVGFEPTCPVLAGQVDFESTPLRPLRYSSASARRVSRTGAHYSKGPEENPL